MEIKDIYKRNEKMRNKVVREEGDGSETKIDGISVTRVGCNEVEYS